MRIFRAARVIRFFHFLFCCAALLLKGQVVRAAPFDANAFWREPNVPFDITIVQTGRDNENTTNNFGGNRSAGPRGRNRRAFAADAGNSAIEWQAFIFTSEIYKGKPMRIYAIYARPAGAGPHPALLSLHGGVDRAQLNRVLEFARAGYACLSFDWLPSTNVKTQASFAPSRTVYADLDYSDWGRMFSDMGADGKQSLIYRVITAARRSLTWMGQQKEVDVTRFGVEGHSWGGYLAQLLAGVEPRLKAVVASASAGGWQRRYNETTRRPAPPGTLPFLLETSIADSGVADVYLSGERDAIIDGHRFGDLSPKAMALWVQRYDPATYAPNIQAPVLLRLGASDFFASVDGLADYWPKIRAPKALQLLPADNHTFADVETRLHWFDYWLKGKRSLKDVTPYPQVDNWKLTPNPDQSWTVTVPAGDAVAGQVAWTTTSGPSVTRQWAQRPLEKTKGPNGDFWTATFTPQALQGAVLRTYISLQNADGQIASTLPQVQPLKTKVTPAISSATVNDGPISIVRTAISPWDNPIIWNNAREVGPVARAPEIVGERSATLRALWDESALYLRVTVADSTPWQQVRDPATWWNSDSFHLRFWASGSKDFPNAVHLVVFNSGTAAGLMAFHDVNIRRADTDLRPVTSQVTVEKNGYVLNLRLPWRWLDSQFVPRAGQNLHMAFLVNDGDLLTNEAILAANYGNAHAMYKPEVWGTAKLE